MKEIESERYIKQKLLSESNLIRVSTYARRHNLSVQAVYKKIEKGILCVIKIDGINFIKDI